MRVENATMSGRFCLSPQQRRLWALQQEDGGAAYRAAARIRLEGPLHPELLADALAALVRRHEILRTVFRPSAGTGEPCQVVISEGPAALARHDLSNPGDGDLAARLAALREEAAQCRFDLENGPLFWPSLVRLAPDRHLLFLDLPALCADRPALVALKGEIVRAYGAMLAGGELAGELLQFPDLAEWQRELLASEEAATAGEHWDGAWADFSAPRLPGRCERREGAPFAPRAVAVPLDDPAVPGAVEQRLGVPVAAFLLAVWQALLARLGGSPDLTVGVVGSGRSYEGLEGALGCLARVAPLRLRLEEGNRFRDVAEAAAEALDSVLAWQEWFTWERFTAPAAGAVPFCGLGFQMAEETGETAAGGVRFILEEAAAAIDRFELELAATRRDGRLTAELRYDPFCFPDEEAQRLATHLAALVAVAAADPDIAVRQALDSLGLAADHGLARQGPPVAAAETPVAARPLTPIEEVLCGLWAEVLGCERVGVAESFFRLGGHSLLATRLGSGIRAVFGVEIPLRSLFEEPTPGAAARRVEAALRAGSASAPAISRVPRSGRLPLSSAQQRLWFLDRLEPDSPVYNLPAALRLTGRLDLRMLDRTLGEIVRRHESLRPVFAATQDGEPYQVIAAPVPVALPLVDLTGLAEPACEVEARRLAGEEALRPFDLVRGPLFRGTVLRLGENEHGLLFTLHHIVADGWSMSILLRELSVVYEALCSGRPSPLPELPVQYADFAVWQRNWLAGDGLAAELDHWRRRLAGMPELLDLSAGRMRPPAQSYRGAAEPFSLPRPLAEAVEALARRSAATPFMVLLTAFLLVLHRHSGQDDLIVGTDVANRTRRETEGLIGFFVNQLVLRADLSGQPGFGTLLHRVRELTLDAYSHQDLPFERLVRELQPRRSRSHAPLFQVKLVLQNAPRTELALPGLTATPFGGHHTVAHLDLLLILSRNEDGFSGVWEYRTDLFSAAFVRQLGREVAAVLRAAVERLDADRMHADPPAGVSSGAAAAELGGETPNPLGAALRHAILVEWNDVDPAPAGGPLLHELFRRQAALRPETTALVCGEERLSYADLARRSGHLARRLRDLGVGPDTVVGLFAERSPEMVVGILAVLAAGGAYLPLDPASPPERIEFLLDDSAARVVLVPEGLRQRLPMGGADLVLVDPGAVEAGTAAPLPEPMAAAAPTNLAYVIYTSGSTGRPKGVLVTHANAVSLLRGTERVYTFGPSDIWTLFHSYAFDFSVWEIWGALAYGGRLVIVPHWTARSPGDFHRLLRQEGVTVLNQTPSAFRELMRWEEEAGAPGLALRQVIFGGEALDFPSVAPWLARHGDEFPHLVNMYGITETTVHVTYFRVRTHHLDEARGSLIGRPLPHLRGYVMDTRDSLVPPGEPGELLVGGEGLARGYLGRPALTAERFVPDPFAGEPGARLYRTGDRVRQLPDGGFEYLGRIDHQVKLRGFRIEPGEIEVALARHPAVREAVVLVREDRPSDRRLAAYVATAAAVTPDELRSFLMRSLPEHMVPAAFIILPRLPLTANGKVDRRALAAGPPPERTTPAVRHAPPRTPAEAALVAIWAEVLRVDGVGVHDNFFELGGDSILSLQVVARARRAGLVLTPKDLFDAQTVAELAALAPRAPETEIEQGEVSGAVPLTPIQRWFFAGEPTDPHHFNQTLLLAARRPVVPAVLERSLALLLEHHDALRLGFRCEDSVWQAEIAPSGESVRLAQVDLAALAPALRSTALGAAVAELQASLDLACGPLLRAALFAAGPEEPQRLLAVIHHLAVDGVSWRILIEDLETAYGELEHGAAPVLPAKTTSFQRWARWLAAEARSETLAQEADYWVAQARRWSASRPPLGGAPAGARNRAGTERTMTVSWSEEETAALLRQMPAAQGSGVDDALLAALAGALGKTAEAAPVLVDLEGHGREAVAGIDLSRTVGWLTTIHPVLLDTSWLRSGEALRMVRERRREIPRRGLGYGLLCYLDTDAAAGAVLRQAPRAEVLFNNLGQLDRGAGTLWRLAQETAGATRSPRGERSHRLIVTARIMEGCLSVSFGYSPELDSDASIAALAAGFRDRLGEIIDNCLVSHSSGFNPADFPLACLETGELARLIAGEPDLADVYPLAPLQKGILFHALYEDGAEDYFEQLTGTLRGAIDAAAFAAAWQHLAERHPVLRTSFVWEREGEPLQVVHRRVEIPCAVLDWRAHAAERERRLEDFLAADRRRGFDLSRAPLLRFALIRVDEGEHILVWSSHHVLLDGWSRSVLLHELFAEYRALRTGAAAFVAPPPSYREHIAWLLRQDPVAAERHWRALLAGFTAPTPLGLDRPAGAPAGPQPYGDAPARLPEDLSGRVTALARAHHLTVHTVLQGAWALLLSRYSGKRDVVFGSVVSGRPAELPGIESMVGLFINNLPVRVQVAPAAVLLPWLHALQETQVEQRRFEFSQLSQIQAWSEIPRGLPLFESMLVFENFPTQRDLAAGCGLTVEEVRFTLRVNVPLAITAAAGAQLLFQVSYDPERFAAGAIARLLADFEILLRAMVERPEARLEELEKELESAGRRLREQEEDALEAARRLRLKGARRRTVHA